MNVNIANVNYKNLVTTAVDVKNKLSINGKTYAVNEIAKLYYNDTLIQACVACKKVLCPSSKNQHRVWQTRISYLSKEKVGEILVARQEVHELEKKLSTAQNRNCLQKIWQGAMRLTFKLIEKLTFNLVKIDPLTTEQIEQNLKSSLDALERKKLELDPLFKENYRLITDNYQTVKYELDDKIYKLRGQLTVLNNQGEESSTKIDSIIELKKQITELKEASELLDKVHTFFMQEAIS